MMKNIHMRRAFILIKSIHFLLFQIIFNSNSIKITQIIQLKLGPLR
jgi:hypothetical protein